MKICHAFRESKEFPSVLKKSNVVSILSTGFKVSEADAPDLVVVAEENEIPTAAIHFTYHYDTETWEVGNVFHDDALSDKVMLCLSKRIFWCVYHNPRPPIGGPCCAR
jgi:hypothetical protein